MTELVATVRGGLNGSCLIVGGLNKNGCKISMENAPRPRVVVDFDRPGSPLASHELRCDYLFIAEGGAGRGWVAPLELKKGRLHAGEAVRQLRAGARAAERLVPPGEEISLRPIAAVGAMPKAERRRLRNADNRVEFRGRMEEVRLMRCGEPLVRALCP